MNKRKSIISILVIIAILITCFINTYAADSDKLTFELKVGSTVAKKNGVTSKIEKPYVTNKTIMIPFGWFATAIGAEIKSKANKKYGIIYGDLNTEITIANKSYIVNSEPQKLLVAPTIKNNKLMVPLEFISKNFPVSVTSDIKKGSIKIVLEDDGALSDLSFLTGGISSPKLGNSYYGWSLSIPSGSRIISNSFKSDKVGITNESRSLYFEISAESKNGRSLTELYNDTLYSSSIRTSKIDLKANIPYFEYTKLSEYDESLRVRVFEKGEYFYYLTINCYDNSVTPEKLVSEKYYNNIVNSFNFNYKGNVKGVEDVSKVKQGQVSFYNYVLLDSDVKYLPWSINIPVKWDKLPIGGKPWDTALGLDLQHYIQISAKTNEDNLSLDEYVDKIKSSYDEYFNPKVYSFINLDNTNIAYSEAINLRFSLKYGNKVNIVDEFYYLKNGLVYEISVNLPENEYDKSKSEYIDVINKMNYYTFDQSKYLNDYEKYQNKDSSVRISQQDEAFEYKNKEFNWSVSIPGYWKKDSSDYGNAISFKNQNSGANIIVTAIENTTSSKNLTDEEKFKKITMIEKKYGVTPTTSVTSENNVSVRTYTYRIESQENDLYANLTFKIFENDKYSYCFESTIYDLGATDKAIKEVEDIWKSFKLTE